MKNRFFIKLCLGMVLSIDAIAQVPGDQVFDQLRAVPMLSPQAASLAKQVEFPVSYFNGMANISIPLYEVQSGDISVPISLSYNTSGIRVNEEASWVGLGWALNAGGMISRQVKGVDEWASAGTEYNTYFPGPSSGSSPNAYSGAENSTILRGCCTLYNGNTSQLSAGANNTYADGALATDVQTNGVDFEPDLYIYNFGNYSGKFMHMTNNTSIQIVDLGAEKMKVTHLGTDYITLIAPDGFTYTFGQVETAFTITSGSASANYAFPVTYHLTTIVSPLGKKVVFNYQIYSMSNPPNPGYTPQLPVVSEEWVVLHGDPLENTHTLTASQTSTGYLSYLQSIVFDNGSVTFEPSATTRSDLNGLALASITIRNTQGVALKQFKFNQIQVSSPDANSTTNDYLSTVPSNNPIASVISGYYDNGSIVPSFKTNRLRLNSILEISTATGLSGEYYTFDYYDGGLYSLPSKSSRSQDYWGYYNGQIGNSTLIPDYTPIIGSIIQYPPNSGVNIFSSITSLANRTVNPENVKAGMLKRITYPTAGWAEYTYESNAYINSGTAQIQNIVTDNISAVDFANYPAGIVSQTIILPATKITLTGQLNCNDYGQYTCDPNNPAAYGTLSNGSNGFISNSCYCVNGGGNCANSNSLYFNLEKLNSTTNVYEALTGFGFPMDISKLPCSAKGYYVGYFNLDAGTYKISANYPDNLQPDPSSYGGAKMASVSLSYSHPANSSTSSSYSSVNYGGGLRIAKIKKYDPLLNQTLVKQYQYTGGILMQDPLFYWHNMNSILSEKFYNAYGVQTGNYAPLVTFDYLYDNSAINYSFSANGGLVGYAQVTESDSVPGNGSTIYTYDLQRDNELNRQFELPLKSGIIWPTFIPGMSTAPYLGNGFLVRKTINNSYGQTVKEIDNQSTFLNPSTYWPFKINVTFPWISDASAGITIQCTQAYCANNSFVFYPVHVGKVALARSIESDYSYVTTLTNIPAFQSTKITNYAYNSDGYLSSQTLINSSDGTSSISQTKYPNDYSSTTNLPWIATLKNNNMLNIPLEQMQLVQQAKSSVMSVIGGSFLTYTSIGTASTPVIVPNLMYQIETAVPNANINSTTVNNNIPADFKLKGTLTYTTDGNLSYSQAANDITTVYLWGYNKSRPIAKAMNTTPADIYFNGFEEITDPDFANSHTGTKVFNGGNYTIPYTPSGTASNLKMSYWYWDGTKWNFSGEQAYSSSITSLGTKLDDIRVYPAGVQMTTYTYDPLKGMTSATDENNLVTKYEYDALGRLQLVRDNDGNILKTTEYSYQGH